MVPSRKRKTKPSCEVAELSTTHGTLHTCTYIFFLVTNAGVLMTAQDNAIPSALVGKTHTAGARYRKALLMIIGITYMSMLHVKCVYFLEEVHHRFCHVKLFLSHRK